jgi:glycosyltransferase involved in cell wall biosynthesis
MTYFLFDLTWGRRLIKDADLFLALTDREVDQYKLIGAAEHTIKILSNGVDLSEFVDLPPRGDFRRKRKIHQNEQIILFLSRINIIKGLDLLLDAFSLLTQALDNVMLVIVDLMMTALPKHYTHV